MCGLTGVAGRNLNTKQIKAFKDNLYVTSMRGPHSTGVASISPDRVILQKIADDSPCFLDYYGGEHGYLHREKQTVLMGHCRWATVGHVTRSNAHPFEIGNIVGAHNGTLKDKAYLTKGAGKTDSELMFSAMSRKGILPVLNELHYWSAFALSIYDKSNQKLYLVRNQDRPLFFGLGRKDATVFWASEIRMMTFGTWEQNLDVDFFACEKDTLYEFDLQTMKVGNMFTTTKLAEKEPPKDVRSSFNEWVWDEIAGDYVPKSFRKSSVTILSSKEDGEVLPF